MDSNISYFIQVILPIRLKIDIFYSVPKHLISSIQIGRVAIVNFSNKEYYGIIFKILENPTFEFTGNIKPITSILPDFQLNHKELEFWLWISDYYMCSIGEVYKCALTDSIIDLVVKTNKKEIELISNSNTEPKDRVLTEEQQDAILKIKSGFKINRCSLLNGVTGSGKTEIYIQLALETLKKGENVLYLVPEIALSRELSRRLESVFKERLLIYHSKQTINKRASIIKELAQKKIPHIILGLRSSIFIPNLAPGLIIVDEEHDQSFKQNEPSPRYNARDCAVFLSQIYNCPILLGSATPSLETLLNVKVGKYNSAKLINSFHRTEPCKITILNSIKERQKGAFNGIFPNKTIEEIKLRLKNKQQVLIYRNRRSYSPIVQCMYCGEIPKCIHCNISLSYHKSINKLNCHYCGFSKTFSTICTECSKPGLKERGYGTELLEERLKILFPESVVGRFDSETTSSKREEMRILTEFSNGKIDILVGTQMIGKGFDFANLNLIVVMLADSLISAEDFRANEKAVQQLTQLAGRAGRRDLRGEMIIHTSIPEHIVYTSLDKLDQFYIQELEEREKYLYPPYIKIVKLTLKDKNQKKIDNLANNLNKIFNNISNKNSDIIAVYGPFSPSIDRVRDQHIVNFIIKIKKSISLQISKGTILDAVENEIKKSNNSTRVIFDVDPY